MEEFFGRKTELDILQSKYDRCIILEPRILTVPETITEKTLSDMEHAIENFKAGNVSNPIDLSGFD